MDAQKILNKYALCMECRKIFVKVVYQRYHYLPYCEECRNNVKCEFPKQLMKV